MAASLSAEQVASYRKNGYLCPIRVMSSEDAAAFRSRLEASEAKRGRPLNFDEGMKPHLLFEWAADLARHPAVLDAVESIIGPNILIWEGTMFTKEAKRPSFVSWHQDLAYWGLRPADNVLTAWIALSPSTVESGCMRVVPGSHELEIKPHNNTYAPNNMLGRGQEIEVVVDEAQAADLVLHPGEMSLHHVKIIHGSNPNRSDDRRIGVGFRYMPTSVEQLSPTRDWAYLARGVDTFGHFDREHAPSAYDCPEAVAVHAAARRHRLEVSKAGNQPAPRTA
jgi:hypothetical protein